MRIQQTKHAFTASRGSGGCQRSCFPPFRTWLYFSRLESNKMVHKQIHALSCWTIKITFDQLLTNLLIQERKVVPGNHSVTASYLKAENDRYSNSRIVNHFYPLDLSIRSYDDNVDRKLIEGEYRIPIEINHVENNNTSATFPISEFMQTDKRMQKCSRYWERQINFSTQGDNDFRSCHPWPHCDEASLGEVWNLFDWSSN